MSHARIQLAVAAALASVAAYPTHAAETQDELLDRAAQWQACLQNDTSNDALARCTQPRQCTSPSPAAKAGWSRPIRLNWLAADAHPAWSTNERARLADLGEKRLRRLIEVHPGTHLSGTVSDVHDTVLAVETQFAGVIQGHRELTDWIRTPRKLGLTARLAGSMHEITASIPIQVRPYQGEAGDAKWLQSTLADLERGTRSLLDEFACAPLSLSVSKNPGGKLALDLRGVRGAKANKALLLIPLTPGNSLESWPVARIAGSDPERNGELQVISGSAELCATEECLAIPL
jgi:hypothetical protein